MFNNKKKNHGELAKALSFITQIAFIIISCILVGVFIGVGLDRLFDTSPWMLLLFSFLGIGAAFKSLYDYTKKMF